MKKTIFITGASSGLGKATALYFQAQGWRVIATMRNPEKEVELRALDEITLLPLDVTSMESIDEAVNATLSEGDVDVVFNNAGYGLMGALESFDDEQILRQINTNLIGTIRITKAFIPYFRERKKGVFISTTSMGGLLAFPLHSIYHATKFALEGWSESMSFELAAHNISIKTIAPGGIKTDFAGRSLDKSFHDDYRELEEKLFSEVDRMMDQASSAKDIAKVVFEAATDGRDQLRYVAGADANMIYNRRLEIGSEQARKEIKNQFI